jgi:hypothetical protein
LGYTIGIPAFIVGLFAPEIVAATGATLGPVAARFGDKLSRFINRANNVRKTASGAKHILKSSTELIVKENHFRDIVNIFNTYKGKLNLFRADFWKHILPHRHIFKTKIPPEMLSNWRKSFEKAKDVIKKTKFF